MNKSEYMKIYRELHKDKIKKQQQEYYQNNKDYLNYKQKEYNQTNKEVVNANNRRKSRKVSTRYSGAKSAAKRRNILFQLTLEEYENLISPSCYYCNGFFKVVETGIGLDRIDNSLGYTIDNCISCCAICNRIKNNILSMDETKAVIELVIQLRSKDTNG